MWLRCNVLCCTSFQNLLHFNVVGAKATIKFEVLCVIQKRTTQWEEQLLDKKKRQQWYIMSKEASLTQKCFIWAWFPSRNRSHSNENLNQLPTLYVILTLFEHIKRYFTARAALYHNKTKQNWQKSVSPYDSCTIPQVVPIFQLLLHENLALHLTAQISFTFAHIQTAST